MGEPESFSWRLPVLMAIICVPIFAFRTAFTTTMLHWVKLSSNFDYLTNIVWWLPVSTMILEKFLYTYVVWYTSTFVKFAESINFHPYLVMWTLFWFIKFLGYTAIFTSYALTAPIKNFFEMPVWQIFCTIDWLIVGQVLNAAVYNALGEVGVLYGAFLGHKIPWVTGFPYNVCPDPQYMGCVFSWWGLLLLLATDEHVKNGWLVYGLVYMVIYLWQSYAESVSRLPQIPYRADKHLRTKLLLV